MELLLSVDFSAILYNVFTTVLKGANITCSESESLNDSGVLTFGNWNFNGSPAKFRV